MLEPPGSGNPYDQLTDEELDQELCSLFQSAGLTLVPAHQIVPRKLLVGLAAFVAYLKTQKHPMDCFQHRPSALGLISDAELHFIAPSKRTLPGLCAVNWFAFGA
jgi:hypothetical protein